MDPYGMVGILELGRHFAQQGHKLLLHLPLSMEVQRCLDRMKFFRYLSESYIMYPPYRPLAARAGQIQSSDPLLEISRLTQTNDLHKIMENIRERTAALLEAHLHYKEEAIRTFLAALTGIFQNILDHSQNTGLTGMQAYFDEKPPSKRMVKIAVMDLGIGFKGSFASRRDMRCSEQRTDITALEEALFQGGSRYRRAGRGHGLATVKAFVQQWGAKLSIRSGTARLSLLPNQEHGYERETGLSEFPGVQISLVLYEV
jgi:signal transduction histidine kinase